MKGKVKKAAQENRRDFIKFVIFGVLIVLMVLLTIVLLPWIISLKDEAGREALPVPHEPMLNHHFPPEGPATQ